MPSDFNSTARSLALPLSPPQSPDLSPSPTPTRPSWQRTQSAMSHHSSSGSYGGQSAWQRGIHNTAKLNRRAMRIYEKMTLWQRILFTVFGWTVLILMILFFVYNDTILKWMHPRAEAWKELPAGWLILWALTFITAFPPMIGYSTCLTIAGFVYGFPLGWPIVATANVIGSLCSFLLYRHLLSKWAQRFAANSQFTALSLVLKHDGLKLLVMIRLCPLPYSFSNGALSTFKTITPLNFALATALATPKLAVHVFIGARLGALAGDTSKMQTSTKVINWASIVFGMILGIGTGWWVYKRTKARAKQLEAEERTKIRAQGRSAGGTVRGGPDASHDLEHPDAFIDDLDDDDESARLRDGNIHDELDFEWGEDDEEPYADEPESRKEGDEEREVGMANGKAGR